MSRKRIVVVCPGRGSYTKESLGYLNQRPEISSSLETIDKLRTKWNEPTVTELDNAKSFKTSLHTKGEHASPLIYSCSYADFLSIDQSQYEIVAMTGNSMGWYLALAFSQALNLENSFHLIQTMGSMMKSGLIGGQIIYPIIDQNWNIHKANEEKTLALINDIHNTQGCEAYLSIKLGGYLVIAGNTQGLTELNKKLPPLEHYPFQLLNHGAFHTPMLKDVSKKAFEALPIDMFNKPKIPLIDGFGKIWQPYSTDVCLLRDYTLGSQVFDTYDFTKSISVSLKEFAPDHLVLLGPGNSLGGAIGQIMIANQWLETNNKEEFSLLQKKSPFLISMGLDQQKQAMQQKSAEL